jgi:hypothetical protein
MKKIIILICFLSLVVLSWCEYSDDMFEQKLEIFTEYCKDRDGITYRHTFNWYWCTDKLSNSIEYELPKYWWMQDMKIKETITIE